MKILQLVTRRQYRGAEVFAAELSKYLVRHGVEMLFVGLYPPPPGSISAEGAENLDLLGNERLLIDPVTVWRLRSLILREKPDIIQANGSDTLKYAVLATLFNRGTPIIYRNISIINSWLGRSYWKRVFYGWMFSNTEHIISVGQAARDSVLKEFGLHDTRVSVIRRGVSTARVDRGNARKKLLRDISIDQTDRIVVHIGHYSREKNHRFLLEVFSAIKTEQPSVKLLLVGDGELYTEIARDIERHSLGDTVFQLGFRSDIENILGAADLLVLVSTVEGVPGVVLEAALHKVPTIAVNVGGVGEVITHGKTGWLVEDHNVEFFARSICEVVGNEALITSTGANAYDFVKDEFDPSVNCRKFLELYKSMVRQPILS